MFLSFIQLPPNAAVSRLVQSVVFTFLMSGAGGSYAFDSGSTGANGPLNITADTELTLPPSGVFNFTEITIADGATLTFQKNAANTPVYMLASGDVLIAGTIDIRGASAEDAADERRGGAGGPGGYDGGGGGFIGIPTEDDGGAGIGPGGGPPGTESVFGGGGAGFAGTGAASQGTAGRGGPAYGASYLIPLIGGSGGGGGTASSTNFGGGGGGGGGALLIAASGSVNISGSILAAGGRGASMDVIDDPGSGGGGSGGAVRIVATTIEGAGEINAAGADGGRAGARDGGRGSDGRIRLEAENFLRPNATIPPFSGASPNPAFVVNLPGLSITSVAGIAAPASPTGINDIVLPENIANPLAIEFATNGIPLGGVIELTATPQLGNPTTVLSTLIGGAQEAGTASASIDLANGPNVLIATTTFEVTASLQRDYSNYAMGESIKEIQVSWQPGVGSVTTFVTAMGNAYSWSGNTLLN